MLLIPFEANLRWFDMPAAQVKFDHGNESLYWVLDFGHRKKCFRMCHKAVADGQISSGTWEWKAYFVIRSSIDFGSRMNVGRVTLFRSAPGLNCDMICESTGRRSALQHSYQLH